MGAKEITELVFVDVETTGKVGPQAREDAVVEIAAARVDLRRRKVVDRFDALVKPWGDQTVQQNGEVRWDLGAYHLDAGHFAGADWTQGVKLAQVLDVVRDRFLTEGSTVCGQNPQFDLDHFKRDFAFLGWAWPKLDYHVIDLVSPALFLVLAGKTEGCSLRHVVSWAYADSQRKQVHRAGQDVDDEIRVFFAMEDYFTKGFCPHPGESIWA